MPLTPALQGRRDWVEAGRSLSSRSFWSIQRVPGQPELSGVGFCLKRKKVEKKNLGQDVVQWEEDR